MVRVLVAGWIGSTNLGDELVLRALLAKLRQRDARVVAISTDPEGTRSLHDIEAVDHRDLGRMNAAARSAEVLLFGGGGLLQDETSRFNLPYHLARVALARRHRTPVTMVGVGAGPLRTASGRGLVRLAFRDTVLGSVRDEDSADVVAAMGLPRPQLAADLVLSLPSPVIELRDRVAVCLRPWHGGGLRPVGKNWQRGLRNEWFPAVMASALDEVADRTGLGIHLVAFQAGRDDAMNALVADRMRHTPTVATPGLDDILDEVGGCRAAITLRYHGAIAATLAGLPSVLVGYSDKVRSLASDLGPSSSAGLGWSPEDVARLPDELVRVLDNGGDVAPALARLRERESGNDAAIDRVFEAAGA